jgi:DNA sulfur modification protein DndB
MGTLDMVAKIKGREFTQFGKKVLVTQMKYKQLESHFEVDQEVQRKIDPNRRGEIKEFILDSLKAGQPFHFSPFIFSARKGLKKVEDGFEFASGCKLYILDGQHRIAAIASAINSLNTDKEGKEEMMQFEEAEKIQHQIQLLKEYPISMQIYLDLEQNEERQLFNDINTERREAHAGLVMQYDYRDQYTEWTRRIADRLVEEMEIDRKKSRLTNQSSAITSLVIMKKCLIALFEGILTVKKGDPHPRGCALEKVPDVAESFFRTWKELFPKNMADRNKYVSGLSGIQIALAYTVFILIRKYSIPHREAIRMLLFLKKHCSWMHTDPLFRHMYNAETGKIANHSSVTAIQHTAKAFYLKIASERDKEK